MHDQPSNKSHESGPGFRRAAEAPLSMWDPTSTRAAGPPPGPLASASTAEKLARWDELAPIDSERLSSDPELGPQLELLKRGEEWLLSGGNPPAHCPSPDALFEFAEAPGAAPLASGARDQVAQHIETCPACADLVSGLMAAAPPAAFLEGRPHAPAQLRLVRAGALAAAALVLIAVVPRFLPQPSTVHAGWPQSQALRGPASGPLLAPGGPVLAESVGAPWSKSMRFSIVPLADASSYTLRLRAHSGGAFDIGEPVLELEGAGPEFTTDEPLDPGHYTWEVWANVDGLSTLLGSRDFELVDNPEVSATLHRALATQGPERVRILHDARLFGDAQRAAEALPSSAERDAYLTQTR